MRFTSLLLASTCLTFACGDDDEGCDPAAQTGCDDGLVCEVVQGGEPACFEPLVVKGRVFDLTDDAPIEGAKVVALDVNGAPVSSVATSDMQGNYTLPIPSTRTSDGAPVGLEVTLRADASAYQTFPSGLRQALPISTAAAMPQDGALVLQTAQTDIGLLPLPPGHPGAAEGSITGKAELPAPGAGVLVVAETTQGTGRYAQSAIADREGRYTIFNLPAATFTVKAYAWGVNYGPVEVTLAAGEEKRADLTIVDQATATLNGKVEIVNPELGTATSVILVVESTFDEALVRGATPPGLRAPEPGVAPNVTGDFTITGIPAGRYVILAAFENDHLVRDPDTCIAGTEIVRQEFQAGQTVDLAESFKVTGALELSGPGASGPEALSTPTPMLSWNKDASAVFYRVRVVNAYGEEVWSTQVDDDSRATYSIPYAGQPLLPGMYYQFHVTSVRTSGARQCEISQSEDLKGVFYLPSP